MPVAKEPDTCNCDVGIFVPTPNLLLGLSQKSSPLSWVTEPSVSAIKIDPEVPVTFVPGGGNVIVFPPVPDMVSSLPSIERV